jgi:hypothetical protein
MLIPPTCCVHVQANSEELERQVEALRVQLSANNDRLEIVQAALTSAEAKNNLAQVRAVLESLLSSRCMSALLSAVMTSNLRQAPSISIVCVLPHAPLPHSAVCILSSHSGAEPMPSCCCALQKELEQKDIMLKQITSNIQKAAVGAATLIHNATQDEVPAAELRPSQALIDSTPKRPKSHKKPAAAPAAPADPAPVPAFSKPKAKGSRAMAAVPAFVEEASMQRHTTSSMAPPKAAGGSKRKAAPVWEEQVGLQLLLLSLVVSTASSIIGTQCRV